MMHIGSAREDEAMKPLIAATSLLFFIQVASAQSPYTGMQTRSIKALSEQQVADLKAGRGMGLRGGRPQAREHIDDATRLLASDISLHSASCSRIHPHGRSARSVSLV